MEHSNIAPAATASATWRLVRKLGRLKTWFVSSQKTTGIGKVHVPL